MLARISPATLLAERSVSTLKGVGSALLPKLQKLGLTTVQDVLFHLPRQYEDRTRLTPIGGLFPGRTAQVEGDVLLADIVIGRRRSLVVKISDGTGSLTLRFYHFNTAQKDQLARGTRLRVFGEARNGANGVEMYHPEYQRVADDEPLATEASLTPIYPATEGVTQARLRELSRQALQLANENTTPDLIGQHLYGYSLLDALRYVHRPPADADMARLVSGHHPSQQRLVIEELAAHQLSLLRVRARLRAHQAPALPRHPDLAGKFLEQLPYEPTGAQRRVWSEIAEDLAQPVPMLRLVQGDVGAGKTVVAALAACHAMEAGLQVAMMAPTEILAEQHFRNFSAWFEPLGISVGWLSGKQTAKTRRETLEKIANGDYRLVVGTHALFQQDVEFSHLGLAIIDEQHRFGVHQRLALKEKGRDATQSPHQLIMTATPIPRTLAMSAYGDLDTSVIDELPPGRTPVTTIVLPKERRDEIVQRIDANCRAGRQAYWVCTLIEESETLEAQAAEATYQELSEALPDLRIGLVHGRLKPKEKAEVMAAFKAGEIHLLVATTVIEVGVDVPNASLMIIENPERLGLAQLHQLRGRVGRGSTQSFCVLLYGSPLGEHSKARLAIMRETTDGFRIAERDLELRGPGEMLGTRQTGLMEFRLADLARDQVLLPEAQALAREIQQQTPQRVGPLVRRWLGEGERYADV